MSSPAQSAVPDLNAIITLAQQAQAIQFYFCTAFTLVIYDYLLTLNQEIRTMWKQEKSLVFFLFILNRYYTIFALTVVTVGFFSPLLTPSVSMCARYAQFIPFGVSIPLLLIPGLLMTLRIWALYERNKFVLIYLLGLLVSQVALCFWIYSSPGHQALIFPDVDIEPFHLCIEIGPPQLGLLTSLYQWTETLFDVSVFTLTMLRTIKWSRADRQGTLLQRIVRDGALYFAVIFTTNLVWVLMIMFAPPGLKYINGMPTLALVSIMMNRITMDLRSTAYGPTTVLTTQDLEFSPRNSVPDTSVTSLTRNWRKPWREDSTQLTSVLEDTETNES
ncbi:hypothetical protein SISSUDRAFT_1050162 [Sistotremastrum suecicum HHB10207 ss-3]|uniref:DUF6533 domain-containing protein n=1 Tax=Sistotremastrum suecicum HHB10207 ss-3 TaxID=1314776 RepID=A0A166BCN7_9AGAM|nr:hypothetical protein SISSUDRAFT_1050162 [Sistotremastrum suecicum HHB10207 ss-3]